MKERRFRFVAAAFAVAAFMAAAGIAEAAGIQWSGQSAIKITTPGGKVMVMQFGETRKFP